MAHVPNVHFSQCRATSMIKARDYCISASVLRWALLRRSDGSISSAGLLRVPRVDVIVIVIVVVITAVL